MECRSYSESLYPCCFVASKIISAFLLDCCNYTSYLAGSQHIVSTSTTGYNSYMKTVWEYSPETEAARILHAARQTAVGFYKTKGFAILPYGSALHGKNLVFLPGLPYLSIPRFWEKAARINVDSLPLKIPPRLLKAVISLLPSQSPHLPDKSLVQLWDRYQNQIIDQIYCLIPGRKDWIKQIIIQPTNYGTGASFNLLTKAPGTARIWLRSDQGISAIVESLLTILTRYEVLNHLSGLWSESEIIVDWLLAYSPLSEILEKIDPGYGMSLTIRSTRIKQIASLTTESEKFLSEIGAPVIKLNTMKNLPDHTWPARQRQLFRLLADRSPDLVTFDEIHGRLFAGHPDSFSLYAISKTVQRLRDLLEKNGVSGSFIQTRRREGYLLYS